MSRHLSNSVTRHSGKRREVRLPEAHPESDPGQARMIKTKGKLRNSCLDCNGCECKKRYMESQYLLITNDSDSVYLLFSFLQPADFHQFFHFFKLSVSSQDGGLFLHGQSRREAIA